jgi:hypothetical protein
MIAFRLRFYGCLIWLVDGAIHGQWASVVGSALFLAALLYEFFQEVK